MCGVLVRFVLYGYVCTLNTLSLFIIRNKDNFYFGRRCTPTALCKSSSAGGYGRPEIRWDGPNVPSAVRIRQSSSKAASDIWLSTGAAEAADISNPTRSRSCSCSSATRSATRSDKWTDLMDSDLLHLMLADGRYILLHLVLRQQELKLYLLANGNSYSNAKVPIALECIDSQTF